MDNHTIIVGVHQPNFFPWLGYFYKIYRSTDFVFLDNVQIEMNSQQAFVNRTKVYSSTGDLWITCPISKEKSVSKLIKDTYLVSKYDWRKKILKTLFFNYQKTPYFKSIYPLIESLIKHEHENLAQFNIEIITHLSSLFCFETKFHVASKMKLTSEEKSHRLIEICKNLNSCEYLSGNGGIKYHNRELFEENNINIVPLNFKHPEYHQPKEFISGLSIIDLLFNLGIDGVKELIVSQS